MELKMAMTYRQKGKEKKQKAKTSFVVVIVIVVVVVDDDNDNGYSVCIQSYPTWLHVRATQTSEIKQFNATINWYKNVLSYASTRQRIFYKNAIKCFYPQNLDLQAKSFITYHAPHATATASSYIGLLIPQSELFILEI